MCVLQTYGLGVSFFDEMVIGNSSKYHHGHLQTWQIWVLEPWNLNF